MMNTMGKGTVFVSVLILAWVFWPGEQAPAREYTNWAEQASMKPVEFIDLRGAPLSEALRLLSEESGINIVATQEATAITVSLFVQEVTVEEAIRTLCKCHGLWYREDEASQVIRIMTLSEYQKDLVVFREEKTRVFTLLNPNAVDVAVAIRDIYGRRVVLSLGKDDIYDEQYELERRFNRMDLLDERGQFNNRQSSSGSQFGSNSGYGGYGQQGRYGNTGGRYGNQNNMRGQGIQSGQQGPEYKPTEAGTRLDQDFTPERAELATRLEQAGTIQGEGAIEAQRAFQDEEAPIYVTVIAKNSQIAVRTGDEEALKAIEELVTRLDVPTPQVLLDVKVLSINLSDNFQSLFDMDYSNEDAGQPNPKSVLVGGADPATAGGLVNGGGGFLYQFLDSKLKFRLQFLEDHGRVTSLATPLLMVANNEVSKVFVGQERPVVTDVDTETITNSLGITVTQIDPVVETRNVGTTLLITPNINSDRTVTLRLLQESSNISLDTATIPVSTDSGTIQEFEVDVVETRQVTGTVVAKDRMSLAIGGLIEETVQDDSDGIPILKDIPLLGIFFGNKTRVRSREELVVIIRPYIVSTPEEAEKISRDRVDALTIHPYRYGKEDSLETFTAEEVPGLIKPGPAWAKALRLHQIGILDEDEPVALEEE